MVNYLVSCRKWVINTVSCKLCISPPVRAGETRAAGHLACVFTLDSGESNEVSVQKESWVDAKQVKGMESKITPTGDLVKC